MNTEMPVSKILVMNIGGMGDLLLSVPALRSLRGLYPNADITLLTVDRSEEVARALPFVDHVRAIPFKTDIYRGIRFLFHLPEFFSTVNYFRALKKERFDLMINFRTLDSWASAFKTALVFFLAGARERTGRNTGGRGFFYTKKVYEPFDGERSEIEYDLAVIGALGGKADGRSIEIKADESAAAAVDKLLGEKGISKSDRLVLAAPGAPWPSKIWPDERFIATLRAIAAPGRALALVGSSSEQALCAAVAKETGAVSVAGLLDFNTLAALVKRARLLLTNDTGIMHLGAALGCPLVALIGPGDTARYYPAGTPEKMRVLHHPQDCSPCFKYDCRSMKCLTAITVEEAVAAARDLLKEEEAS